MYTPGSSFFSKAPANNLALEQARCVVLKQLDFALFQSHSLALLKAYASEEMHLQWQLFCKHVKQLSGGNAQKMLLMQVAFQCLENPLESGELAQLITLTCHLQSVDGLQLMQKILSAKAPKSERKLQTYLTIFQLLIDLHATENLFKVVTESLPNLNDLLEKLHVLQADHFTAKYPERDLDVIVSGFAQQDNLVQFPLGREELAKMKQDYIAVKDILLTLKSVSDIALQEQLKKSASMWREQQDVSAKLHMIAVITETIRRKYRILPYDTQILSLLALINTPPQLKGRIAQIKTGEGKSTIIAMLAAFMGAQGYFVDMVTSSGYLAIRDCKKYQPFFTALGLSTSHISYTEPKQKYFHAQILYGTNTDFEFSMLRDGLYNQQLRRSKRFNEELIARSFEVVIIDEVDNLFLDAAMSSAQMGVSDNSNTSWIYEPIFRLVQSQKEDTPITSEIITQLRAQLTQKNSDQVVDFTDKQLTRWLESAYIACYKKKVGKDYLVTTRKNISSTDTLLKPEIVVVDYACTGRSQEGTQWQHGIHQFLQIKHDLQLTPPNKTGASVSHPTFFNLYQHILGLTGTMGEAIERQEIQGIYQIDSFDVPPHIPSARQRTIDSIWPSRQVKWSALLQYCILIKQHRAPLLILFKTIEESNGFSEYLAKEKITHQLLNETQPQAEDYLVARAGEPGIITIATNTAGRGTDIIVAPESKNNGGLRVIFAFYPDNLRVEGQGFGRAGRQGNPGCCWMVLDIEDEGILSLIKLDVKLLNALQIHLHLQVQSRQNIPCAEIINLLNEVRTSRIQQESIQRAECAKQEQYYFGKLQTFFSQMAQVHALVENESFKDQIIQGCIANSDQEVRPELFDASKPEWMVLKEFARRLQAQSQLEIVADWHAFTLQFKQIYLGHIRDLWASYFSKLKDPIETEGNREIAFQEVGCYLLEPEKMVAIILGQFFSLFSEELQIDKVRPH